MSHNASRWLLLPALCLAACLAATGCRVNPVTGEKELVLVSASQEFAIGNETHPNVIFAYDGEYQDPEVKRYLGAIVVRLRDDSHRPDMPVDFTVVNTSVINAFATPGHVYATRGFLARLDNEAEFASVVGHELAHVAAGHTAKQLTTQLMTGLVFSAAGQAAGQSAVGQVAVGLSQAGVALMGLSYSREQERQADRVGTYYMALAGYDARQAIQMQKLLASLNTGKSSALDKYLSTHPASGDRIGEIEAVIAEKDLVSPRYIQGDGIFADRWKKHLTQLTEVDKAFGPYDTGAKLLAQKNYQGALDAAEQSIAMRPDQAQFYRLKGDALVGLKRLSDAKAAYTESLAKDSRYVPANVGLGIVYLESKDLAAAEGQFAIAARGFPGSMAAWYGLGMARYGLGRYAEAIEPLETVVGALADDPQVHYALGVCYDRTGRPADAYASYRLALTKGLADPEKAQAAQRVAELAPSMLSQ